MMQRDRITKAGLICIGGLLALNLGVVLQQPAHAGPGATTYQYKIVGEQELRDIGVTPTTPDTHEGWVKAFKQGLNNLGAQGWRYIGSVSEGLVFAKP